MRWFGSPSCAPSNCQNAGGAPVSQRPTNSYPAKTYRVPMSFCSASRENGSAAAFFCDVTAAPVRSGCGLGSHCTSDLLPATRVGREPSVR